VRKRFGTSGPLGLGQKREMSTQEDTILTRLRSADRLLHLTRTSPLSAEAGSVQVKTIATMIEADTSKLSVESLARIAEALTATQNFTDEHKAILTNVIGAKAANVSDALATSTTSFATTSTGNQDYRSLTNFLPRSVWDDLVAGDHATMIKFLVKCGLRRPNEHTRRAMSTAVLLMGEGFERASNFSQPMKAQILKTVYAAFRKEAEQAPNPPHYLFTLPPTPEALRKQYQGLYLILYADEPPEVSPHPESVFQSLAAQTKCRLHPSKDLASRANQLALGDGSMANMNNMMTMFGQMMQQAMRAARSECNLEWCPPRGREEGAGGERRPLTQANGDGFMLLDGPCPPQGSNRANIRRSNAHEDLGPLLDSPQDALPPKWKEPESSPCPSRTNPASFETPKAQRTPLPPTLGSSLTVPSAIAAEPPPMATSPLSSTCAVIANDSQTRQSEVADAAKAVLDAYEQKKKTAAAKAAKERQKVVAQRMAEDLAKTTALQAKGESGVKVESAKKVTPAKALAVKREHEHGGLDGETPPTKPKKIKTKSGPEYEQYKKEMTMSMVYNMLKPKMGHEAALIKAKIAGEKAFEKAYV